MVYSYYLMVVSFFYFFIGVYVIVCGVGFYFDWAFFSYYTNEFCFSIVVDWMSCMFSSFVMFISSLVMYYSIDYMGNDKTSNRFGVLVFLFVFSMFLVINSYSLVGLLLGWDGLGLVSYCLVIYYQNPRSYNAGMITILSNRIGDVALLLAISWLMIDGDWTFIFFYNNSSINDWVIILCLMAAFTSSAQMPFSAWLPMAMAAPTPVSALVHSSTLVTAGVYLMIRFGSFNVEYSLHYRVLCFFSLLTMFMAGLGANYEFDLKKIIALSTLSQLGLMMFILSVGMVNLAFFHLLTHAMFKALLFLCAGGYIHVMGDSQDIRCMGWVFYSSPFISSVLVIASMSLFGFPFMAGFYSKDSIIEFYLGGGYNMFIVIILLMGIGLTSCYNLRLSYYVMWRVPGWGSNFAVSDCSLIMLRSMIGLLLMSIVSGSLLSWLLFSAPQPNILSMDASVVVLFSVFMGIWTGYMVSWGSAHVFGVYNDFVSTMWFLTPLSGQWVVKSLMNLGDLIMKMSDAGWIEYSGGYGVYRYMMSKSGVNQWWQSSYFSVYMYLFLFWVFLMVLI